MTDISKSIKKTDGEEKISGKAKYVADIKIEGMLHAITVRSKISSGYITNIDVPELPEGYFTVSVKDIPGKNIVKIIYQDQPIFTESKVTYIGEPIMLVVGPNKAEVKDIVDKIKIDYETTEPVFEWTNSAIHYHFEKGTGNKAFDNASRIITHDYETGYQEQAYIENQGFIGYP